MTLVLRYHARSDRGLVRQNNQDAVYAGPRLLALADGMGGHAAGEVASTLVIAAMVPLDDDAPSDDLLAALREALDEGNDAITRHVAEQPDLDGMGTTLTAILFAGSRLGLVHVGDSRAYLLRDGSFSQITKDDTFVQSLIDEGRITEEEAQTHPQRSLLLRALTGHDVEPSLTVREARAGDRYLLCSDGLSGVVSDETLAKELQIADPQECADRLIELALRGGGPDNITCIVADVVDVDFGEDAPIVGGAAGDGSEETPPDSAAARASATLPRAQPRRIDPAAAAPPRRKRFRIVAAVVLGVAVLAVGGVLARAWVMQQYYVGATDDRVVIFQGVRGSVLGFELHDFAENSCASTSSGCSEIQLADLQEDARSAVRDGIISNNGLDGARATVQRLRNQEMLPPCPGSTTPSGAPGAPEAATPSAGASPGSGSPDASGAPTPTVVPPAVTPIAPPAAAVPAPPGATPVPDPLATETPLPSVLAEPGKTCRSVG